jgi:hypothetical protein
MLLTKTLIIKWNGNQRKHYEDKGYTFTNFGDEFECNIKDIPHSSDRIIECKCDYCGRKIHKQLKKYYNQRKVIPKDCCNDCTGKKNLEVKILRRGTASPYVTEKGIEILKQRKISDEKRIWPQVKNIFKERNYILLSKEYISNNSPIYYICKKHNDKGVQHIDWVHLQDNKGCKYCGIEKMAESQRFSYDYVKNIIEEEFREDKCKLVSNTYSSYNDYNLKIKCECGEIFTTNLGWFIKGKRKCNNCNSSIGEKIVNQYLKENNYIFKREYEIYPKEWENPLYYDFYIPDLKIAIEYDGEQHFKPVDFKGEGLDIANEKFELQKLRDEIKNKFSKNNNIHLIRIPYWDRDNISIILNKELHSETNQESLLLCSNE